MVFGLKAYSPPVNMTSRLSQAYAYFTEVIYMSDYLNCKLQGQLRKWTILGDIEKM